MSKPMAVGQTPQCRLLLGRLACRRATVAATNKATTTVATAGNLPSVATVPVPVICLLEACLAGGGNRYEAPDACSPTGMGRSAKSV